MQHKPGEGGKESQPETARQQMMRKPPQPPGGACPILAIPKVAQAQRLGQTRAQGVAVNRHRAAACPPEQRQPQRQPQRRKAHHRPRRPGHHRMRDQRVKGAGAGMAGKDPIERLQDQQQKRRQQAAKREKRLRRAQWLAVVGAAKLGKRRGQVHRESMRGGILAIMQAGPAIVAQMRQMAQIARSKVRAPLRGRENGAKPGAEAAGVAQVQRPFGLGQGLGRGRKRDRVWRQRLRL